MHPRPATLRPAGTPPGWDLFCRVIDNRGDAGVGWRLARQLAGHGQRVRLWIDDPAALDGMDDAADRAHLAQGSVRVHDWPGEAVPWACAPGTAAVVELFGCTLPDVVQGALAAPGAPVWVNLEYLSAEGYVERSHGLASPRLAGPGAGAVTWFFYPGFGERTGGLLGEEVVPEHDPALDRLSALLPPASVGALRVSRFDYRPARAERWLSAWAEGWKDGPLHLLLPGAAGGPDEPCPSSGAAHGADPPSRLVRHPLPWLPQSAYDALLRACDLNLVRGEDSFVRAQWAARPMLWQIYPQDDGAHAAKLEAWLDRYLDGAEPALAGVVRRLHRAWNAPSGAEGEPTPFAALSPALLKGWTDHARRWRDHLRHRPGLCAQLMAFVARRRAEATPGPPGTPSG